MGWPIAKELGGYTLFDLMEKEYPLDHKDWNKDHHPGPEISIKIANEFYHARDYSNYK